MLLLLQTTGWPWWVKLIAGAIVLIAGIIGGIVAALPWRAAAQAANSALESKDSDLQSMRSQRNEAAEASAQKDIKIALMSKDIEILETKTNYTQFRSTVEGMFATLNKQIANTQTLMLAEISKQTEALEKHSVQDAMTFEQTLKQLIMLNEKLTS